MPIQIRGQNIDLLGLDWGAPGSPRADGIQQHMQNLLARRRSSAFPILLAHHPHAFDPAAAAGIPLTLSGHTHGVGNWFPLRIGAPAEIIRLTLRSA